jgi:hypothetical protein
MTASEISPEPPKAGKSNLVKQLIGAAIAILLLYLAFKNVDGQKLWQYSKEVSPVPVLMVVVISIISHLLRAYRWTFLLKPLAQRRIGLFNAFYAVILGYAVNVAIPRGGEVADFIYVRKKNFPGLESCQPCLSTACWTWLYWFSYWVHAYWSCPKTYLAACCPDSQRHRPFDYLLSV